MKPRKIHFCMLSSSHQSLCGMRGGRTVTYVIYTRAYWNTECSDTVFWHTVKQQETPSTSGRLEGSVKCERKEFIGWVDLCVDIQNKWVSYACFWVIDYKKKRQWWLFLVIATLQQQPSNVSLYLTIATLSISHLWIIS